MTTESAFETVRVACEGYIGRSQTTVDTMGPEAAEKVATILGVPAPQNHLPPTWHWAYFNRAVPPSDVGPDGHERLGRFLPPAPFERRMWASGEVEVARPLRIGVVAHRTSTIADVRFKSGSTGPLCFVTVHHHITQNGARAIDEHQTIVYRDRPIAKTPPTVNAAAVPPGYIVHPDTMLIAYSAVTHNGHRIHWDRDYCRTVEGYPGLVVHGPLLATELCDVLRDGKASGRFAYRATAPVFEANPVRLVVEPRDQNREGFVERLDGVRSMKATWAPSA